MKKIGIVGVGGVASYAHIPSYLNRGLVVSAICDIDEEKLNFVGDKYNIKNRYLDLEDMLKKEKLDILDVATPPSTHEKILEIANKYNVEILMQKPLIVEENDLNSISEKIYGSKRFKLNMQGRYVSAWCKIKEILDKNLLGKPFLCTINNNDWWDRENGRWDLDVKNYIIFEMLIHHLDLCNYWFGYPKRVAARGGINANQNMKNMNYISVMLEYENGLLVQIIENWGMSEYDFSTGHPFEDIIINGENGCIKANSEEVKFSKIDENDIKVWCLPRPGQKLKCETLTYNWFNDAFGELMKEYINNENLGKDEDKKYAIDLTKMLFAISKATTSQEWINF